MAGWIPPPGVSNSGAQGGALGPGMATEGVTGNPFARNSGAVWCVCTETKEATIATAAEELRVGCAK